MITREDVGRLRELLSRDTVPLEELVQVVNTLPALLDLAERYLGAAEVAITESNQLAGTSDFDYGDMLAAVVPLKPGTFVRIVPVENE